MNSRKSSKKEYIFLKIRRPLTGKQSGFVSVLNKHDPNHGKSYFETTNSAFFGQPQKPDSETVIQNFEYTYNKESGGNKRAFEDQRIKTISSLCGELPL